MTSPTVREPLERALRDIANALFGFGLVSLVVAALALAGTVAAAGRVSATTERVIDRIDRLSLVLESTTTAIDEAVSGASSFEAALSDLGPTLERTVATLQNSSATLGGLGASMGQVAILGSRPFASVAASLATTAADLASLAASLDGNRATIDRSREALARVADTLPPMAEDLRAVADDLGPELERLLDDVRLVVILAGIGFAAWVGIPGAGALLLGRRLRRALVDPDLPVTP